MGIARGKTLALLTSEGSYSRFRRNREKSASEGAGRTEGLGQIIIWSGTCAVAPSFRREMSLEQVRGSEPRQLGELLT